MSGWTKTDVDGKIMWESPSGERVRNPMDIPSQQREPISSQDDDAFVGIFFVLGIVIGLIAGILIGRAL